VPAKAGKSAGILGGRGHPQ